jgi:hypothetical protein
VKWLIVNADDLGLSPGVNEGIIAAHQGGIVTSASLMINLPAAAQAAALAKENPQLGVGLHLNLSAGRPLTPCQRLCAAHGSFLPFPHLLRRLAFSSAAQRQARAELEAQVERAVAWGLAISHLDSHHHIHLFPPLLEWVARLAQALGLPLRLPVEATAPLDILRDWKTALTARLAVRARRRLGGKAPLVADHFLGLHLQRSGFDQERLAQVLSAIREGVTEFMCHPGRVDQDLLSITRYAWPRQAELEALTAPRLRETLEGAGVQLTNWLELRASTPGP